MFLRQYFTSARRGIDNGKRQAGLVRGGYSWQCEADVQAETLATATENEGVGSNVGCGGENSHLSNKGVVTTPYCKGFKIRKAKAPTSDVVLLRSSHIHDE